MRAVSIISTMNVLWPCARLSGSAHAGEDAIAQAKLRFPGGDERAHLREEADQRGLAEHGRLTGHIGAGDQQEPPVLIHMKIVGHERGFPDDALDDRGDVLL